jgi:hypothetical protein
LYGHGQEAQDDLPPVAPARVKLGIAVVNI